MSLGNSITIKTTEDLELFITNAKESLKQNKTLKLTIEARDRRTLTQNSALHLYCEQVAHALNDAGLSVNTFFKEGFEVPFSKEIVKENIWKPVQEAVIDKKSTAEANKLEYGEVYDHVNRKLSEYGIHVEWPSKG